MIYDNWLLYVVLVLYLSKQGIPYTASLIVASNIYQGSKQTQASMSLKVLW